MEEDLYLINKVKNNKDDDSIKELINRHSGIYIEMVNRYIPDSIEGINKDDIIQDKSFCIYDAAISFNEDKNTKFSTYVGNLARWKCLNIYNKKMKFPQSNIGEILNEKILPTYKIGTYSFSKNRFEIKEKSPEFETRWGGESGAALLTNYLNPEKYTLFTNRPKQDLIKDYRLIPNEDGEIIVYSPFWKQGSCNDEYQDSDIAAHPLLIYAELLYSNSDRNLETAKIIFDEYIEPNL